MYFCVFMPCIFYVFHVFCHLLYVYVSMFFIMWIYWFAIYFMSFLSYFANVSICIFMCIIWLAIFLCVLCMSYEFSCIYFYVFSFCFQSWMLQLEKKKRHFCHLFHVYIYVCLKFRLGIEGVKPLVPCSFKSPIFIYLFIYVFYVKSPFLSCPPLIY